MKLSFAHIVLNVTDMKRSRPFYEKILKGFKIIDQSDHHAGFSNGSFGVWIADEDMKGFAFKGVATDKGVGLHHFAWKVESVEELKEWEGYLQNQGIEMSKGGITDDDFGGRGIFFRDPDNIRLEIHLGWQTRNFVV